MEGWDRPLIETVLQRRKVLAVSRSAMAKMVAKEQVVERFREAA